MIETYHKVERKMEAVQESDKIITWISRWLSNVFASSASILAISSIGPPRAAWPSTATNKDHDSHRTGSSESQPKKLIDQKSDPKCFRFRIKYQMGRPKVKLKALRISDECPRSGILPWTDWTVLGVPCGVQAIRSSGRTAASLLGFMRSPSIDLQQEKQRFGRRTIDRSIEKNPWNQHKTSLGCSKNHPPCNRRKPEEERLKPCKMYQLDTKTATR